MGKLQCSVKAVDHLIWITLRVERRSKNFYHPTNVGEKNYSGVQKFEENLGFISFIPRNKNKYLGLWCKINIIQYFKTKSNM